MGLKPRLLLLLCVSVSAMFSTGGLIAVEIEADVREHIEAVEQGLLPAIRIKGRSGPMLLSSRMDHYNVPGMSIAVINDGRIKWARGYGVTDVDDPQAVDEHTLFQAASISKPVAALGALELVESGKLALDEDVNKRLKSWKLPDNEFTEQHPVTLETLLSHTAGTTVHGFGGYQVDAELPTLPQILDGLKPANSNAVRVDKLPGEGFRYSGGGTTIVQLLIEDVSGRPFAQFMQDEVLTLLGMSDSSYEQPLPADRQAQAASGHYSNKRPVKGSWHVYPERAAAGLWTTPSDLARYAIEVQSAYQGRSHKVLSRETVHDMLTPRGLVGLGPFISTVEGTTRFSHGGSNEGFKCLLVADRDSGQGAVVMTNGDQGGQLAREVMNAIASVYGWRGYLPPEREVADIDDDVLKRYVGHYNIKSLGAVLVKPGDGYLSAKSLFGPELQLFFESETDFFTDMPDVRGKFVVDDEGKIELMVQFGDRELRGKKR